MNEGETEHARVAISCRYDSSPHLRCRANGRAAGINDKATDRLAGGQRPGARSQQHGRRLDERRLCFRGASALWTRDRAQSLRGRLLQQSWRGAGSDERPCGRTCRLRHGATDRSETGGLLQQSRRGAAIKKSDVDNALADYDRAVRAEPKVGFFHQERAKARLNKGDIAGSLTEFREAFRLDPKLTSARDQAEALASVRADPKLQQMPANPPVPGRRVALVIGNGLYDRVTTLDNPRRDAALMADELRKVGFASVEVVNDAKLDAMKVALDRFESEAAKSDWAVIYYSGHGIAAGATSYLLPVDIKRVQEDVDLQNVAIPLDRLLSAIQRAKKMRLVILDACRDDPFGGSLKRTITTRAVTRGLARADVGGDAGLLVAYSAQPGAVAADGPAGSNSPYTSALARNMDAPGVEMARVFRLVYDDVSRTTDNKQRPSIERQFGGGDLIFRGVSADGKPAR